MRKQIAGLVWVAVWALSAVQAAEPSQARLTPEEIKSEAAKFATPMEYARSLKAEAEQGDGRTKYKFAMVLLMYSPDPFKGDQAEREKWRDIGSAITVSRWVDASAQAGYRPAMEHLCRIGQDRLAPADLQAKGMEWCEKLEN